MSEAFERFTCEISKELKARALSVKDELRSQKGSSEEPFLEGMLVAYRRTIGLMQEKARECRIDLGSIDLDDIDPKKDLSSLKVL